MGLNNDMGHNNMSRKKVSWWFYLGWSKVAIVLYKDEDNDTKS